MTLREDYSHEVRPSKSAWQRKGLAALGTLFLATGIVGAFLPILPTTPFLLLAAACYARSSPQHYNALMNHRVVGSYLRDWRAGKGIPIRAKFLAVSLIGISFGFSVQYIPNLPGKILFLGLGAAVAAYLLRFPTKRGN